MRQTPSPAGPAMPAPLSDVFLHHLKGVSHPRCNGLSFSVNMRNNIHTRSVPACRAHAAGYLGHGQSLAMRLEYEW